MATGSDISLLVARDLSVQLKHLPSYTHHVCVDAINTAVVDEDKWCVTGRKEWRVLFEYDIFAHLIFGRRKMDCVTFKHLQELAPGYEGRFPSEIIKQDNFCCLNSQPRKISTSRIDEAFEDFLEGLNQKCFATICRNEIQSDRIWL